MVKTCLFDKLDQCQSISGHLHVKLRSTSVSSASGKNRISDGGRSGPTKREVRRWREVCHQNSHSLGEKQ
ncbi:hypothetical protein EVAR_66571_1 [Eumeta japonica]|uniref:Uncharacterized protein n=1 Tax=Eumeta variegata TaxID=151549 RepID=A0A4C1Z8H0_EUMVA|nr:hypothetical protein EVAR_66571_1 [Eumeta japonica]